MSQKETHFKELLARPSSPTQNILGSQLDLYQRGHERGSWEMVGITYWVLLEGEQPARVRAAGAPGRPPQPTPPGSAAGAQSPRDSGMQGVPDHSATNPHPSPPQTWRKEDASGTPVQPLLPFSGSP